MNPDLRLSRFRWKISTLLAGVVFLALIFALVAQQFSANRREQELKARLRQSLQNHYAQEGINRLISDLGIDILKDASEVELLRVARPVTNASGGTPEVGVVTPTGLKLETELALRATGVLLDHRNFGYILGDEFLSPHLGLRIKSDSSSLDILISLDRSSAGSPHQDVWIQIHDKTGKQVHFAGPHCLTDPSFQKLAEELLKR